MARHYKIIISAALVFTSSCQQGSSDSASSSSSKSLYIASGQCYAGSGITTYSATTASRTVTRWDTSSGAFIGTFTDLNVATSVSVGTVPQSLIDAGDSILLLTENATTTGDRKIFRLYKNDPNTYITYANDPTAFTSTAGHVLRSMALDTNDGTIQFAKSIAIEKVNTVGARVVKGGGNPWINSTGIAANCFAAAASLIPTVHIMAPYTNTNQGKTLYLHAGNAANLNRIGVIQRTGMTSATAADCATSANMAGGLSTIAHTNAPNLSGSVTFVATGASPTSSVYIPTPSPAATTGKLIVSYSASVNTAFDNNTNFNYGIVMWDITETSDTAVTVNNPVILWRDETVVWAPSAMAYDATTSSLYVAVGGAPGIVDQTASNYGFNVEKFTLDLNTPLLTRVSTNHQPFLMGNTQTKCISDMKIGD